VELSQSLLSISLSYLILVSNPAISCLSVCPRSQTLCKFVVLLLLGLRATNQLLTITAVCVIEMADAYGAGNAFPKEASNTDDWLDAIGLVRPCSVQARCRITSPIVYKCGVCDPQSRCKEALAGMSLVDIVNMTDSERRERVPIDGQRKRLVAFLSTHTHARAPRALGSRTLICGRSRLHRYWLCRRSIRARRHRRSSTTRPPPSTSTRPSRSRAPRR